MRQLFSFTLLSLFLLTSFVACSPSAEELPLPVLGERDFSDLPYHEIGEDLDDRKIRSYQRCEMLGTVYMLNGEDGCGIVVQTDDGHLFHPTHKSLAHQKVEFFHEMRIAFDFEFAARDSECNIGKPIHFTCLQPFYRYNGEGGK
ncbi:MAG: hypothetical protein AAFR61_20005 [Bacteroidota bacterium]